MNLKEGAVFTGKLPGLNTLNSLSSAPYLNSIYRQLLDHVDVGIMVINHEGRTVIYNRKMSEIDGMEKEDVLYKDFMEVFHFENQEESRLLNALYKGEIRRNEKQTYFSFKGKEITTINDAFPVYDEEHNPVGAVEIARDITRMERMTREQTREKQETLFTFEKIIGESRAIQEVIESARKATRTSSSVFLTGETGTGKELFAQSIHNGSPRSTKPFISQNCAALPETLIESILFGTVKGAFTGATESPGLFEQAHGGTLVLDEINLLSLPLQAKLLRVIQEKRIRRIGDTRDRPIDVRIIATMNEDPWKAVTEKRLREDLYYRLSVVFLEVPPLRQRKEDLPILVEHFIASFNRRFQMNVQGVTEEVMERFFYYKWPGNVRELEHIIEGAMNLIYHNEAVDMTHLPPYLRYSPENPAPPAGGNARPSAARQGSLYRPRYFANQVRGVCSGNSAKNTDGRTPGRDLNRGEEQPPTTSPPLYRYLSEMEKQYIKEMLEKHGHNVSQTAKQLGISRQSLQYRLNKYGL